MYCCRAYFKSSYGLKTTQRLFTETTEIEDFLSVQRQPLTSRTLPPMHIMMRLFSLFFTILCLPLLASGQHIEKSVKPFTRVVASPRVNVVLSKGAKESVRLVYSNLTEDLINIIVTGKTLRIYLDNARKYEKQSAHSDRGDRKSLYEEARVTAYVTYKELDMLEIRGSQQLYCEDPIESDAFTLRAYGENDIHISFLKTPFFKAKLYGENDLQIRKGRTLEQKYVSYGENRVDTKGMRSDYIITSIFGEGSLKLNSAEEVRIDAFGEPEIHVDGGAQINRRLVIGKANIQQN
jgi:hypothetical protein